MIIAVFGELARRNALQIALSGRDEVTMKPILSFLCAYLCNPSYTRILLDICNVILGRECIQVSHGLIDCVDLYSSVMTESPEVKDLLFRLKRKVSKEVSLQAEAVQLLGILDLLMNSSIS